MVHGSLRGFAIIGFMPDARQLACLQAFQALRICHFIDLIAIPLATQIFLKKYAGYSLYDKPPLVQSRKTMQHKEVGMRYKMILGQTLFSFFKKGQQDIHIKEVRLLNRDQKGEVRGTTRLLYDEESGTVQRYVNGSAPIASLSDDMVCFLAEVSRCFGRITGNVSWENDVWLCVDTETIPETTKNEDTPDDNGNDPGKCVILPFIAEPGPAYGTGIQ
jgi:hypothetical protein